MPAANQTVTARTASAKNTPKIWTGSLRFIEARSGSPHDGQAAAPVETGFPQAAQVVSLFMMFAV